MNPILDGILGGWSFNGVGRILIGTSRQGARPSKGSIGVPRNAERRRRTAAVVLLHQGVFKKSYAGYPTERLA